MNFNNSIKFTLDASNYEGINYTSGVDKNDVLCFSQGRHALVVCKEDENGVDVITAYPFKWSKFDIIRYLRFTWIYFKYYFYKLRQILKAL
jgi:hypothetical protein